MVSRILRGDVTTTPDNLTRRDNQQRILLHTGTFNDQSKDVDSSESKRQARTK